MVQKSILILNPTSEDAEYLSNRARKFGTVSSTSTLQDAISHLETKDYQILIVDKAFARYAYLKGLFRSTTCVLITGMNDQALRQSVEEWPVDFYVDTIVFNPEEPSDRSIERSIERAVEHAGLKREVRDLKFAFDLQEAKVRDVYSEIQDIKGLINSNFLQEIEKRISIEAKYLWFQRERRKVENILRKIYAADDVSSLLDIVPDIRELVQAGGITVYIIEENETLGKYLKPLVWDNTFPYHSDFSAYNAPLDSQDFAAAVARYGQEINVADLSFDRRMSKRYVDHLKKPLKSLLGIPIMRDKEVIGVLEAYNKIARGKTNSEGFNREDMEMLRSLAEHIANAMTKLNLIQYDALTGLLRPDPFFEKALQKINTLSKRRREEGANALAMGDVDWFKNFNDRNGHEAGNRLLRGLAHILKISIREEDLLCRYGGEEFLFFLTGVKSFEEAAHLTERIRKNVEDHYFENQEFQPGHNLTMSFGVTIFPKKKTDAFVPTNKADLKQLAGEADLALAEAKGKRRPDLQLPNVVEAGPVKNRVSLYSWGPESRKKTASRPMADPTFREKRKHERYNASTLLMYDDSNGFKVSKTVNLSLDGARIVTERALPVTKTIDAMLVLGDRAGYIKSEVVYSMEAEAEPSMFYSGLKFRDLTFREIKSLEDYLLQFRRRDYAGA